MNEDDVEKYVCIACIVCAILAILICYFTGDENGKNESRAY